MLIEPHLVQFTHDTLLLQRLPEQFDGIKVAFITDTHADSQNDREFLARWVERINADEPDIVLIGGDIADSVHDQRATLEILSGLSNTLGIFAVRGNHDTRYTDQTAALMSEYGITPLINQGVVIEKDGAEIRIAGVDGYLNDSVDANSAIGGYTEEDCVMLLAHEPDFVAYAAAQIASKHVDLAFVGHTHGGQITMFGLYSQMAQRSMPAYSSQWVNIDGIPTFHSNGFGQFYPLRFFARPQAHVFTLRSKGS